MSYKRELKKVVVVQTKDDLQSIDPNVQYYIDGIIDMESTSIEIPAGGINISGINFNLSGLISTSDNYTMFTSPAGGSGTILIDNIYIETSGTNSKVWDIVGDTGFEAIELNDFNYIDCTSLGTIESYRQGLERNTGRFGGTPELELSGPWIGGYFIDTSIVRNLTDGSYFLYKAGPSFSIGSRFRSNQNIDLNSSIGFIDFSSSNINSSSNLQLNNCLITRNGVLDSSDTTIIPNIDASDVKSLWRDNIGVPNTFLGGRLEISSEITTTITSSNTYFDLSGTYDASLLSHFDSPANGRLRYIASNPTEFRVLVRMPLEAPQNNEIRLKIVVWDDSEGVFVDYKSLIKTINNFQGGRDVAYFNFEDYITLYTNDYIKLQVENTSGSGNITAEIAGALIVNER